MGGYGSGGGGYNSKYAVEDALSFSIYDVWGKKDFYPRSGTLHWSRNGVHTSSMGYHFLYINDHPILELNYNQSGESVKERIRVEKTLQPYGNFRYWMLCPILVNGYTCNRRCYKMYSPPGQKYFGCRTCMNLTYQSCKDSHKFDGFLARMANDLNIPLWAIMEAMK
jgi:hypothetical protein